jgi:rSAM/selenodomain-associated transferase 1
VIRQLAGNGVVMVFTKAPVPGSTKTRLIPALGPQGAARLHKRLIQRTLSTVGQIEGLDVELWCTPSTLDPFLISCGRRDDIPLIDQCGDDLGTRMHNAFKDALRRAPWAILIGTDVPALEKTDITRAILELQSGTDVVIGPAVDGGYYLLGLRKSSSELFNDIPWGTSQVHATTLSRLQTNNWTYTTIDRRRDLDTPEDLSYFNKSNMLVI